MTLKNQINPEMFFGILRNVDDIGGKKQNRIKGKNKWQLHPQ